ncbi:TolB family protein [Methylomonas rhizoryzae]|uniref:TolB family protein n=1 Tax=Methylomonas rhizoryzae TaxID=2608981 RepID=UPI0016806F6C|nr:PD40 domain-containing protein [Methylomonas rhizoryzae]
MLTIAKPESARSGGKSLLLALLLGTQMCPSAKAAPIQASVDSAGAAGNAASAHATVSRDGSVAFESLASNLVANDSNAVQDIFLHRRKTGETVLVSVDSSGVQGNKASSAPGISANGRRIVFQSSATNLVANDSNGAADIFLRDLESGETRRISLSSDGTQSNGASQAPTISADGNWVVFSSRASNLVEGDDNGLMDIFIHNVETGTTERINPDLDIGTILSFSPLWASISLNARRIGYSYQLIYRAPDNELTQETRTYVFDRKLGKTERVYRSDGKDPSFIQTPLITNNGRILADFGIVSKNLWIVRSLNRKTGNTSIYPVAAKGLADSITLKPGIAANGRWIAYQLAKPNSDGSSGIQQVYVRRFKP